MADTITITLSKDDAWNLMRTCSDSARLWHRLWQEAVDGKRPDLSVDACLRLSHKAWALYEQLEEQGAGV